MNQDSKAGSKTDLLGAALSAAAAGVPIFPCNPVSKAPLTEHGFKDATADREKVTEWWTKWPRALIGSPTGETTGRVVIDIDSPRADAEFRELAEQHDAEIPSTYTVQSSPGRRHLYFNYPAGKKIGCSDRRFPGEINVRANGGYVILPPSPHPAGGFYALVNPTPKVDLPSWLLEILTGTNEGETISLKEVTPRWAAGKITRSLAELKRAEKGTRNNVLNEVTWWLARLSDHPLAKHSSALAQLGEIARSSGLEEGETRATIDSAWRAGLASKLRILPIHETTDLGNADRFVLRYGDRVHFVPKYGSEGWLIWDGHRWKPDAVLAVRKLAHETVRAIYQEAAGVEDDNIRRRLSVWAMKSESDAALDGMLKEAKPYVSVSPDELDSDPELLNLENGTLDLRTGEVREQRRDDLITRMLPVCFEPRASAPLFEAHLRLVLPDEGVRNYFMEMIAYSFSGDTAEQAIHVLWGGGENGKSTTDDLFRNMAGDYGAVVRREFFADGYKGVEPHDVADLLGKRFVTCSEFEEGDVLRVAVMKGLTSGTSSRVKACRKYGHPFEFTPQAKYMLDTNHLLRVDSDDHGTWRRIRVIPFGARIPEDRKDEHFQAKLWEERSGVLNLVIQALKRWNGRGRKLVVPKAVVAASNVYKQESDLLGQFLDECCVRDADAKVKLRGLARVYADYARSHGIAKRKVPGERALKDRLASQGLKIEVLDKADWVMGLGPRDTPF